MGSRQIYPNEDNYLALMVCMFVKCTPEMAFERLIKNVGVHKTITQDDVMDMVKLKQEMSYKAIGEMFGITDSAVFRRIERYKKKNPDWETKLSAS